MGRKLRSIGRVARLMAANWPDAVRFGLWSGREPFRSGIVGLGWFLIVATPIIFLLHEVGVLPGLEGTASDALGALGFFLGGVLIVLLDRRLPRRQLAMRHFVLSERDEQRRYVPVCSCGWVGQPQTTVEHLLLAGQAHRNDSVEPMTPRATQRR